MGPRDEVTGEALRLNLAPLLPNGSSVTALVAERARAAGGYDAWITMSNDEAAPLRLWPLTRKRIRRLSLGRAWLESKATEHQPQLEIAFALRNAQAVSSSSPGVSGPRSRSSRSAKTNSPRRTFSRSFFMRFDEMRPQPSITLILTTA